MTSNDIKSWWLKMTGKYKLQKCFFICYVSNSPWVITCTYHHHWFWGYICGNEQYMVWEDYMRTLCNPCSAKTNDLPHLQNTPLLKPTTDCPIIAKGAVMVANCNRQDRYLLPVWESAHLAAARAYSKPGMGMGLRLNESMTHHPPPGGDHSVTGFG